MKILTNTLRKILRRVTVVQFVDNLENEVLVK